MFMRKMLCVLVSALFLVLSAQLVFAGETAYEPPIMGKVTGDNVFLRIGPGTQNESIRTVGINTGVMILAEETGDMQ